MPSVSALGKHMTEWARGWSVMRGFPDYYTALAKSIQAYFVSGPTGPAAALNFEKVLGSGDSAVILFRLAPPAAARPASLRNSRRTGRGASKLFLGLEVRAAPFALLE